MLSDEARLELVESLTWLASELDQERDYERLKHELYNASKQWAKLEKDILSTKPDKRSETLLNDFESAQLSYVILRALWDNQAKTWQDAHNHIRGICNMLDIDVFGDLKDVNMDGCDLSELGLR